MARYEDFTFDQGSDIGMELRLINEDKTPKNLTGYSVAAKLSPNYAATDSDKTNFSAFVASPATDGIVTLTLTNEQTDALKPRRRYVYDVEIFFQDEETDDFIIERVLEGIITVAPSVTK
jgi:hypothetical protein